jgi:flagellar biosynthesis/type III secretory pathway M-ring protein FliF/YscJ
MAGGRIVFAIATEVNVDGGGAADLQLKSARRLAENATVFSAQRTDLVRVLNIDSDIPSGPSLI